MKSHLNLPQRGRLIIIMFFLLPFLWKGQGEGFCQDDYWGYGKIQDSILTAYDSLAALRTDVNNFNETGGEGDPIWLGDSSSFYPKEMIDAMLGYYIHYNKYMRFTSVAGSITYNNQLGWGSNPTATENGNTITVSGNSEFTNSTYIRTSNEMCNYSYINSSTLEIYPPSGYGTVVIEVWIY